MLCSRCRNWRYHNWSRKKIKRGKPKHTNSSSRAEKKSPLLSGGKAASHGLQGIGANFIPKILDRNIIDEIIGIDEEEAYLQTKSLGGEKDGILCGISSGGLM